MFVCKQCQRVYGGHGAILFAKATATPPVSFSELVGDKVARALATEQVFAPNSMQAEALTLATSGHDVLTIAQTGSGKTLTFLLPILLQQQVPQTTS